MFTTVKYASVSTCKCCEYCAYSYLQNQELEHEEKQGNECLALLRNNNSLYKHLLRSSWEGGFDKLINLPFLLPKHFCSDPSVFWGDVCLWRSWRCSAHHLHAVWCSFQDMKQEVCRRVSWGPEWWSNEGGCLGLQIAGPALSSRSQVSEACVCGVDMCECTCVCVWDRDSGPSKVQCKAQSQGPSIQVSEWYRKKEGLEECQDPKTGPRKTQRIQQSYSHEISIIHLVMSGSLWPHGL